MAGCGGQLMMEGTGLKEMKREETGETGSRLSTGMNMMTGGGGIEAEVHEE